MTRIQRTLTDQEIDLTVGGVTQRPDGGGCTDPIRPTRDGDTQQPDIMRDLFQSVTQ